MKKGAIFMGSALRKLWRVTDFERDEVSDYASQQMLNETRQGVRVLSVVLLVLLLAAAVSFKLFFPERPFAYSYGLLALLALHIYYSSLPLRDIRALHALGMTLLVIIGVALIFIGRQTGELDSGLAGSVVLLFMVIPLVPWGLREALAIVGLIYLAFTLAGVGALRYFSSQNLWALQFLMLGASLICLVVVARNVLVRKNDLANRYDLEAARRAMELQSFHDPLTGVWNRRYLEQHFELLCDRLQGQGHGLAFALVDIDHFKGINDSLGHDIGDQVLRRVVSAIQAILGAEECLVRMGGDEFALLMAGDAVVDRLNGLNQGLSDVAVDGLGEAGPVVSLSIGVVPVAGPVKTALNDLYRQADQYLYEAKRSGRCRVVAATTGEKG